MIPFWLKSLKLSGSFVVLCQNKVPRSFIHGLPRDAGQRNKSSQLRFSLSHTSSEITVTNTQTYFRRDQSSCSWEEPFLWKNFAKRGDPRCLLTVLPLNQRLSARKKGNHHKLKILLIVREILHVSTTRKIWRKVRRTCMLMLRRLWQILHLQNKTEWRHKTKENETLSTFSFIPAFP